MRYDILLKDNNEDKINEIIFDYFLNNEEETVKFLPNFSTINIIVGTNNSGKSRFMRYLMGYNNFIGIKNYLDNNLKIEMYNKEVNSTNDKINDKIDHFFNLANRTIYADGKNTDAAKANTLKSNRLSVFKNFENMEVSSINRIINSNISKIKRLTSFDIVNTYLEEYSEFESDLIKNYSDVKKYFIPTLRTAHSLYQKSIDNQIIYSELPNKIIIKKIEEDIFLETINEYHNLKSLNLEIFTGLHLYKEILNARNAQREIRKSFEKFEDFIGKNFFEGKNIDIVSEFNKDENLKGNNNKELISLHIEGEKKTRKLHELGDGIQALIILMYKIFMAENDSFIFIDEPELNLHPGMQRLFLEQITTNKDLLSKNLTYIIATHSNHLLDLTIEKDNISIYSFSKELDENEDNKFVIKSVNAGDNEVLRNLGVNNSSVFLANCSVWVEGISDRNYIKAFLNAYCVAENKVLPREDIDFAFFEYSGGNIEHYIFGEDIDKEEEEKILKEINTMALSNRIYLLADSDMTEEGSKKDKRLKKLEDLILKEKIGGKIFRHIRESENLLSKEVWKKILIEFCNKNSIKYKQAEIQVKINNIIDKCDLKVDKYIGCFLKKIKSNVNDLNEICKKDTRGTWLTFKDKAELSRIILKKTINGEITWEDFKTPEVEELTKSIYQFISKE